MRLPLRLEIALGLPCAISQVSLPVTCGIITQIAYLAMVLTVD